MLVHIGKKVLVPFLEAIALCIPDLGLPLIFCMENHTLPVYLHYRICFPIKECST